MVASFLVSYTRSKAETLGLKGDVGIGSRAERVVVICLGLAVAPWGGLQWAIYLLAATAWITVGQRIWSVRTQLGRVRPSADPYAASTPVLARKSVFVRMPRELKRRLADEVESKAAAASTTSRSVTSPPASPCLRAERTRRSLRARAGRCC